MKKIWDQIFASVPKKVADCLFDYFQVISSIFEHFRAFSSIFYYFRLFPIPTISDAFVLGELNAPLESPKLVCEPSHTIFGHLCYFII